MSEEDWTTIRIRRRVVAKGSLLEQIQLANTTLIPSKTSRGDVIEAALAVYARSLGIGVEPEPVPRKKGKR